MPRKINNFINQEELKILRSILGYSLKDCSYYSGNLISPARLSHYEQGVRNASLNTAVDLTVIFIKLYRQKKNDLARNKVRKIQQKQMKLYLSILSDVHKRIKDDITDTKKRLEYLEKKLRRG